ncbi:MAG: homoserine kinase [Myxococcales bacterium]
MRWTQSTEWTGWTGSPGATPSSVPREAGKNAAAIAARAMLGKLAVSQRFHMWVDKGLPLAGGLGGSAASSVAGALAAHLAATGKSPEPNVLIEAALAGEAAVAGRHLDNIAPCVLGGLTIVRSVDPQDVVKIPVPADWYLALVTPAVRVETKAARALLPKAWEQAEWVQQMANTTSLAWAFASSDAALVRRALDDRYAEPRRAALIPHFADVKAAALAAGALGCTISGSGPTVFALAETRSVAQACAAGMQKAFAEIASTAHVGAISRSGARPA